MSPAPVATQDAATPRPQPEPPNYITERGMAKLQERLGRARRRLTALGMTELERDFAAREVQQLETRVASAVPVARQARDDIGFGATVDVSSGGQTRRWRLVGADEADPPRGAIHWNSPLARALLGARVGDAVTFNAPAGAVELVVLDVSYAA
ncbi:MAG TPA: GreA/GreB family elongation factor [Nevskiaceae bacterium]|nr:GreA/GreB family elongation factor [Nevskiaceae bacterium]